MKEIDEIVKIAAMIMVISIPVFLIRSVVSPKKKVSFTDVSKLTPRELMESNVPLEDIVRSVMRVEGIL